MVPCSVFRLIAPDCCMVPFPWAFFASGFKPETWQIPIPFMLLDDDLSDKQLLEVAKHLDDIKMREMNSIEDMEDMELEQEDFESPIHLQDKMEEEEIIREMEKLVV